MIEFLWVSLYLLVGMVPFYYRGLWPSIMLEEIKEKKAPVQIRVLSPRVQKWAVWFNFALSLTIWPLVAGVNEYKLHKREK